MSSDIKGLDEILALGRGAHSSISSRSKIWYLGIVSSLRQRWSGSMLRIVVSELCRFPLRIQAVAQRPPE